MQQLSSQNSSKIWSKKFFILIKIIILICTLLNRKPIKCVLEQLATVQEQEPALAGVASFNGNPSGNIPEAFTINSRLKRTKLLSYFTCKWPSILGNA